MTAKRYNGRSGDLEDAIARADRASVQYAAAVFVLSLVVLLVVLLSIALERRRRLERAEWSLMVDVAADELRSQRRRFDVDPKGETTERGQGEAKAEDDA